MKTIVGIQTAQRDNFLSIFRGGDVTTHHYENNEKSIEKLSGDLEELLISRDTGFEDIALVIVCTGPGSFTGTRGGVAFAKGLCQFTGIPLVGVSAFEVLETKLEADSDYLIMLDARNSRVYTKRNNSKKIEIKRVEEVLDEISKSTLLLGSGVVANQDRILEELSSEASTIESGDLDELTSDKLFAAGIEKYENDKDRFDKEYLLNLSPLYVSPPNITKSKK